MCSVYIYLYIFLFSEGGSVHVAGGEHKGIVINKDGQDDSQDINPFPHLSLEFRVFLVNTNTGKHAQVNILDCREFKHFYATCL